MKSLRSARTNPAAASNAGTTPTDFKANDLSQSVPLEVEGRPLKEEFHRTARKVNRMVDELAMSVSEVTRVDHEVGTDGGLGGQAIVPGVAGNWKDLAAAMAAPIPTVPPAHP